MSEMAKDAAEEKKMEESRRNRTNDLAKDHNTRRYENGGETTPSTFGPNGTRFARFSGNRFVDFNAFIKANRGGARLSKFWSV